MTVTGAPGLTVAVLTYNSAFLPFAFVGPFFVVCCQRCPVRIAALTFPAWLVKNLSWSTGIGCGLLALAFHANALHLLRSKRAERALAMAISVVHVAVYRRSEASRRLSSQCSWAADGVRFERLYSEVGVG